MNFFEICICIDHCEKIVYVCKLRMSKFRSSSCHPNYKRKKRKDIENYRNYQDQLIPEIFVLLPSINLYKNKTRFIPIVYNRHTSYTIIVYHSNYARGLKKSKKKKENIQNNIMKLTIIVYRAIIVYLSENYQKLIDSGEEIKKKIQNFFVPSSFRSVHFTTTGFNKIREKNTG